jgi:4-diphosphocytidyl-2-C-methyl-D-erythritol kinase
MILRPTVRIPAKVNLHLEVLGRRPDGYHEVRTLLQSIDLFDDLTAESAPDGVVELQALPSGAVPEDAENLVVRAAHELWGYGEKRGARLTLTKRIPVGGGLGGGSADAAGALVLLDRLWGLSLSAADLYRCAAVLGSDVPFFLLGGLALGVARGDEVYPLPDLPELGVVVAVPDLEIETSEVYGRLHAELTRTRQEANVDAFAARLAGRLRWESMLNDLQQIVVEGWPVVADVLADLATTDPLRAAVSGSGAAAYAVYADRRSAEAAAATVGTRWWTHVGVTLGRARARPKVEAEEGAL